MIYAVQPTENTRRIGVFSTLIGFATTFALVLVPPGSTHQLTILLVTALDGAILTILYLWHRNLFGIPTHPAVDGIFLIVISPIVNPR